MKLCEKAIRKCVNNELSDLVQIGFGILIALTVYSANMETALHCFKNWVVLPENVSCEMGSESIRQSVKTFYLIFEAVGL